MIAEIDRVLSNPDNLIVSDDLDSLLGSEMTVDQTVVLDEMAFVCSLKTAKLLSAQDRRWEFKLEVPGLEFGDIAGIPSVSFNHGPHTFAKLESLEMICNDGTKCLVLVLKEIITSEEDDDE